MGIREPRWYSTGSTSEVYLDTPVLVTLFLVCRGLSLLCPSPFSSLPYTMVGDDRTTHDEDEDYPSQPELQKPTG